MSIVLAGTEIIPFNANRNSTTNPTLVMKFIDNASVANANSDTAVGGATFLEHSLVGSGRQVGGGVSGRDEWILKPSEDYLLRFVAIAAGFVDYHLSWYENTNIVPLN